VDVPLHEGLELTAQGEELIRRVVTHILRDDLVQVSEQRVQPRDIAVSNAFQRVDNTCLCVPAWERDGHFLDGCNAALVHEPLAELLMLLHIWIPEAHEVRTDLIEIAREISHLLI
jgi:hypothetical protein